MTSIVIDITLTLFNIVTVDGGLVLVPVQETVMASVDACWAAAVELNTAIKGTGYMAACWPLPTEALVQ